MNVINERSERILTMRMATDIVVASITQRLVSRDEMVSFTQQVFGSLSTLGRNDKTTTPALVPAVNPKNSIHDDYIICLEDGKKFKSLKRHLMTHYNLTPDQYREKWGLKAGYPMVAPAYAEARSLLAKKSGLGRRRPSAPTH